MSEVFGFEPKLAKYIWESKALPCLAYMRVAATTEGGQWRSQHGRIRPTSIYEHASCLKHRSFA